MEQQAKAVDDYLKAALVLTDEVLERTIQITADAGLLGIEVTVAQGKLLMLLAQLSGARKVLEIGTLGGYSTLWLARGISDEGRIISCELKPRHADVARANLEHAGVGHQVDIRVGPRCRPCRRWCRMHRLICFSSTQTRRTTLITWSGHSNCRGRAA